MFQTLVRFAFSTASGLALLSFAATADDVQITQGEYLVTISGCNDCHAGLLLRKARPVALSWRLGCGLRDSRCRCCCRPQHHA